MEKPEIKHLINTIIFFLFASFISYQMVYNLVTQPDSSKSCVFSSVTSILECFKFYFFHFGLNLILVAIPLICIWTFILYIRAFSQCNLENSHFSKAFICNILSGVLLILGFFLALKSGGFGALIIALIFFILASVSLVSSIIFFLRGYSLNRKNIQENKKSKWKYVILVVILIFLIFIGIKMYLDQRIVVIPLSEQIISCSKVTDYSEQAGCYRVLAENTKDSSLCDRIIQDPSKYNFREECYYSIASITQDPQICNKIYSIPIKINCCNQIQDSSKKAICS